MTEPSERARRRIPRIAYIGVPLLLMAVSVLLIGIAWRANREARQEQQQQEPGTETLQDGGQGGGDSFVVCTDCHEDLDKVFKEGGAPTLLYTHEKHFATGVSDCAQCHPANTHEPDTINKPTMSRCFVCHGLSEAAIAPGECTVCHPPGMPAKPSSHESNRWVPQEHGEIARDDQFECLTCHQQQFCTSCHGLRLPHPDGWQEDAHVQAFFDDAATCQQCHPREPTKRDYCDSCHHPQGPKDVAWRAFHFKVVKSEGAQDCFQCHDPATCASCHIKGKESFEADRTYQPPSPPAGGDGEGG